MKRRGKSKINFLITSGPTREPLDPVRYLSNYSTGFLGVLMAKLAAGEGHCVTLVHGSIPVPEGLKARKVPFETALDLKHIMAVEVLKCDCLVMIAAVSDFKPLAVERAKIKKGKKVLRLTLVENPDVLKTLTRFKGDRFFIGFSVESTNLYQNSFQKLKEKGLDLIVAQKATNKTNPFGNVRMDIMFIDKKGNRRDFKNITKDRLARHLIESAEKRLIL